MAKKDKTLRWGGVGSFTLRIVRDRRRYLYLRATKPTPPQPYAEAQ
jgi:hypothetical protein